MLEKILACEPIAAVQTSWDDRRGSIEKSQRIPEIVGYLEVGLTTPEEYELRSLVETWRFQDSGKEKENRALRIFPSSSEISNDIRTVNNTQQIVWS